MPAAGAKTLYKPYKIPRRLRTYENLTPTEFSALFHAAGAGIFSLTWICQIGV